MLPAYVAWQLPLLPIFLLWYIERSRGEPPKDYVRFATALYVSWWGDLAMWLTGGSFEYSHLWAPAQLGLAYVAVIDSWGRRRMAFAGVAYLVAVALYAVEPDKGFMLWSVGGVGLLCLAWGGALYRTVFIYFGLGTVAYFVMITQIGEPFFTTSWYLYQTCRGVAIAVFCQLILRSESTDG